MKGSVSARIITADVKRLVDFYEMVTEVRPYRETSCSQRFRR